MTVVSSQSIWWSSDNTCSARALLSVLSVSTALLCSFIHCERFLQRMFDNQNRTRFQEMWIVNLSSTSITEHQKSVLSKGLNFAPTPNKVPVPKIITNIETALKSSKASPESISGARSQIVKILGKPSRLTPNLTPSESKAMKELRKNNTILILPADKGRATVIMDKDDYNSKMLAMLNDADIYKKLP